VGGGSLGAWKPRAASIPAVFAAAAADRGLAEPDAPTFAAVLDAVVPGLRTAYDAPHSLAAACPRPFLIISGEGDGRCPLRGIEWAVRRAERVYAEAGAADRLAWSVHEGVGHEMTDAMDEEVLGWMGRWLKGR
jgi:predicted esterase